MMSLTEFKPQLVGEGDVGIFLHTNEVVALEPKIDGMRIIIEKRGESMKLYSRLMKDWTNKFKDVVDKIKEGIKFDNCVLDGEMAVVKNNKIGCSPDVLRKELREDERLVYFPFDVLEIEDQDMTEEDYLVRKQNLMIGIEENQHLSIIPHTVVDNDEDVQDFYKKLLEKGFEGIVLKDLKKYIVGSRFNWIKKKPFETLDLQVASKEPRKDNKGWKYTLSDNGEIVGRASSKINILIKETVEVKFEKKFQKEDTYRLRFPQIIRVRDDK